MPEWIKEKRTVLLWRFTRGVEILFLNINRMLHFVTLCYIPCWIVHIIFILLGKCKEKMILWWKLVVSFFTRICIVPYFREHKIEGGRNPIALIICMSHNKTDVYYSAGKNRDDIFVAEYKIKLPSEEEIKRKLSKIEK